MGRLNRISHNLQLYMQHHTGIPTKYYTVGQLYSRHLYIYFSTKAAPRVWRAV